MDDAAAPTAPREPTLRVALVEKLTANTPGVASRSDGVPRREANAGPSRVAVSGKFLVRGESKFRVKGVTYGTFAPDGDGVQYPARAIVERDFELMVASGLNTVRVYTPPPVWLLDVAARQGLLVMIGLCWEQHVAFLRAAGDIERRIRAAVRPYVGHPAVLCYAVGNEIPAVMVRWYGRRRVERFLHRLYKAVKREDADAIVTYVNFPTTEYLDLHFLDILCFNVYLEQRDRLTAYLARLQNLADERPLLMAEVGLDSCRNGEAQQAAALAWQIAVAFEVGCAGVFVFAWTDEWYRGGAMIDDWDFGLVRRDRSEKRALRAIDTAFSQTPFPADRPWPRVSVIVCTYNGRKTIQRTFEALSQLDYPDYEVIVVSDGSSDGCVALAYGYGLRVIAGPNQGLSAARNLGFRAASGSIVAYIDDDAYPDPEWLRYLTHTFLTTDHVAVGGPNLAPGGSGWVADCVANSPGGPSHVLISDSEAEHIPGCNMAYRKAALEAIDGFDVQFRIAGDDVDLCWRLLDRGWTIGFSPAAMVWHFRRNSIKAYWRQQKNYGKAEAMLERRWPRRFSTAGHPTWSGRVYGRGHTVGLQRWRARVYQGLWGSAPFQSVYEPPASIWEHLPQMPEWYLVNGALLALILLGVFWPPLLGAVPIFLITAGAPVLQAARSASRAVFPTPPTSWVDTLRKRLVTGGLHLLQPLARLWGRLSFGLSPWRIRSVGRWAWPIRRHDTLWSETWRAPETRIEDLREVLVSLGAQVDLGGEFERCDIRVRGGLMGWITLLTATEDHAAGTQLFRVSTRLRTSLTVTLLTVLFAGLGAAAFTQDARLAGGVLAALATMLAVRACLEQSAALATARMAIARMAERHGMTRLSARRTSKAVA